MNARRAIGPVLTGAAVLALGGAIGAAMLSGSSHPNGTPARAAVVSTAPASSSSPVPAVSIVPSVSPTATVTNTNDVPAPSPQPQQKVGVVHQQDVPAPAASSSTAAADTSPTPPPIASIIPAPPCQGDIALSNTHGQIVWVPCGAIPKPAPPPGTARLVVEDNGTVEWVPITP